MRVEIMLLGLLIWGGVAAEGESGEEPDAMSSSESIPSLELLEFLGTFQDQDGLWFDPLLLVEEDELLPVVSEQEGSEESPMGEARTDD